MDESPDRSRPGGTIYPNDLGDIALASIRRRAAGRSLRYELRDPFAEVTYRTANLHDIIVKAEKMGSDRFTEIDDADRRTTLRKVDGQWQRGPQRPAMAPRAAEPVNERDEVPERPAVDVAAAPPAANATRAEQDVARTDPQAERAALLARLEVALNERYVIKRAMVLIGDKPVGQTEYRFRGDTSRVAFTESTFRLATDTNSPSVARSMVDVAEARAWKALRVSGHEEFRRMVWFEATLRGVRAIGYEPLPSDMAWLRSEREARQINRIEPAAPAESPAASGKASARIDGSGSSGSRKTVLAAIEAVLVAQRVPEKRREAIMAAAADNLAKRLAAGEVHKVKVYDKAAPQQQPVVRPAPEQQRARERTAHVR
jgi:hypothetical protein